MKYQVNAYDLGKLSLNETDPVKGVLQNVAIILATIQGTAPLYREFGIPRDMVDRPIPVAKVMMTSRVKEAVERFEPRASVVSVRCQEDVNVPGRLVPTVEVEILP